MCLHRCELVRTMFLAKMPNSHAMETTWRKIELKERASTTETCWPRDQAMKVSVIDLAAYHMRIACGMHDLNWRRWGKFDPPCPPRLEKMQCKWRFGHAALFSNHWPLPSFPSTVGPMCFMLLFAPPALSVPSFFFFPFNWVLHPNPHV